MALTALRFNFQFRRILQTLTAAQFWKCLFACIPTNLNKKPRWWGEVVKPKCFNRIEVLCSVLSDPFGQETACQPDPGQNRTRNLNVVRGIWAYWETMVLLWGTPDIPYLTKIDYLNRQAMRNQEPSYYVFAFQYKISINQSGSWQNRF